MIRIGSTDGLPCAFEDCIDAPCRFRAVQILRQQFHIGKPSQKLLQAIFALEFMEAFDNFHDCDDRDSVATEGCTISGSVCDDILNDSLQDLRENIRVE